MYNPDHWLVTAQQHAKYLFWWEHESVFCPEALVASLGRRGLGSNRRSARMPIRLKTVMLACKCLSRVLELFRMQQHNLEGMPKSAPAASCQDMTSPGLGYSQPFMKLLQSKSFVHSLPLRIWYGSAGSAPEGKGQRSVLHGGASIQVHEVSAHKSPPPRDAKERTPPGQDS